MDEFEEDAQQAQPAGRNDGRSSHDLHPEPAGQRLEMLLRGQLRAAVDLNRGGDVVLGDRPVPACAPQAVARDEDQRLHARLDRCLRHGRCSIDVGAPEVRAILPIVGKHRRAVKNCIGLELRHRLFERGRVAYVECLGRVTGLFDVLEAIDADDLPAFPQQTVPEKSPEESSRAGDDCANG